MKPHLILLALLPVLSSAADLTVSIDLAGQPVTIPVSAQVNSEANPLSIALRADLSDFQSHLTPLLQAELNQSSRCGDRIAVQNAALNPAGQLTVRLHFEKWACIKAFGKENARRLVGGDGLVHVLLTPVAEHGDSIRLSAEVGDIEADGSLGEALRAGALKDKVHTALAKALSKSADFSAVLPAEAKRLMTIDKVAFADGGEGHLNLLISASAR